MAPSRSLKDGRVRCGEISVIGGGVVVADGVVVVVWHAVNFNVLTLLYFTVHTRTRAIRHITVMYNPVGGGGKARRLVGAMVIPVLQLCKLKFKVLPTKYRRHAVELMQGLNPDSTDGVIVCGGDGLVHEIVTGYFMNPNLETLKDKVAIGICPCGTANAMANALHTHENTSQISIVGRAALATCKGGTRKVDVIKCIQQPCPTSTDPALQGPGAAEIYGLSCFGWGMAGAVALKADKLRWIPGQRSMRYDIAGFASLVNDWPVADKGTLEYREAIEGQDDPGPWVTTEISVINLIVTNMATLGRK
jgi:diacylglycerol kinase family enzyme